jgi:Domain of unknown function (DUF4129)
VTARQQLARLVPLALLVVLAVAGLRGRVAAPRWDGPLRADGTAIGIAVEVVFGLLLVVVHSRTRAARREHESRPYHPSAADKDLEPAEALRFLLRYLLPACMIAVAVVVLVNLHLHFFTKPVKPAVNPIIPSGGPPPTRGPSSGGGLPIPVGPILYGLLIALIVAAVVVSVWWSLRLRRPPAPPPVITDVSTEELREAIDEGRAALAGIDDARGAIIACYLAMEASLADRGTARAVADTPDELLARAVAAGTVLSEMTVRGAAAGRLTTLFYEARFSTHPLDAGQRDAASAALDELAAELA